MLSRVADSLYWMSRYIERAENNARIAEVNLQLMLDLTNQQEFDPQQQWQPIISSLEENELFASLYAESRRRWRRSISSACKRRIRTRFTPVSAEARENARTTREQISSEMWEQINRLYLFVQSEDRAEALAHEPVSIFPAHHRGLASFPGHHPRHEYPRRRLALHAHRPVARARGLHLASARREISHPAPDAAKAWAATSTRSNGCRC